MRASYNMKNLDNDVIPPIKVDLKFYYALTTNLGTMRASGSNEYKFRANSYMKY
jgi:hypothetical protein